MAVAAQHSLRKGLVERLTFTRFALAVALVASFLALVAVLDKDEAPKPLVDRAVQLVPSNALIYVHANLDRGTGQWQRATHIVDSFPSLGRLRGQALAALSRRAPVKNLGQQVDPWLGDEGALALLPGRARTARSLILLAVSDRQRARAYLAQAVGVPRAVRYRGVTVDLYGRLAAVFVGRFLAIGRIENVAAAIDTRLKRSAALDRNVAFVRSRANLAPGDAAPLLTAYASPTGLRNVLASRRDLLGRITHLLDDRDLVGAAASVSVPRDGVRLRYTGLLSSGRDVSAVRREEARRFVPRLVDAVPESAIAFVGARGVDRVLAGVETVLGTDPRALSSLRRLGPDLDPGAGSKLDQLLQPVRGKEAALFAIPSHSSPVLTMLADDLRQSTSANLLSGLQTLLGSSSSSGQVSTLEPARIAGIDAATVRVSPTFSVTYALLGRRAVVSTDPNGLRALRNKQARLTARPQLSTLIGEHGRAITSVLFLDLERLLGLGARAGLSLVPAYQRLEADLTQVKSVSAVTSSTGQAKAADIFIEVK